MTADDKTRVTVTINGVQYKLMGSASKTPAYLQMVASAVDDQMRRIFENAPHLDLPRVAVLTAVNIADELHNLSAENNQLRHDIATKDKRIALTEQQFAEKDKIISEKNRLIEEKDSQLAAQEQVIENYKAELDEKNKEIENYTNQFEGVAATLDVDLQEDIYAEHMKLKEEYRKLQQEYNDWIQLLDNEEP